MSVDESNTNIETYRKLFKDQRVREVLLNDPDVINPTNST